jgi:argininosuccinate lyase
MLPQKKNPDIAELARAKTGRLVGNLTGLLVTLKGLPLAYNRDLQEDKEPVFDSVDQVSRGLVAVAGMIDTVSFRTDRMAEAANSPYAAATDLAEYLVAAGTPFRHAHAIVGSLVRRAVAGEASLTQLVADAPEFDADAIELLAPGVSVTRRTTHGGAGPTAVATQLVSAANEFEREVERWGGVASS